MNRNKTTFTIEAMPSLSLAQYLWNGSRYTEIYELNKATLDARNKGTGNTKYTI